MCAYISPRTLQLLHNLSKKTWKITEDEESLNKESYFLYQNTMEYWGKVGRFADQHIYIYIYIYIYIHTPPPQKCDKPIALLSCTQSSPRRTALCGRSRDYAVPAKAAYL
jgi:hypothetical protein